MLEKIECPADVRELPEASLTQLATELRAEILATVAKNGGHLSSSLGVVELTIALHKVFNTPTDSIVWDVGHQSYAHKLLTGRHELFSTLREFEGCSGFQARRESVVHDPIGGGHAGTAISSALGLEVAAMRTYGAQHPRAIAVVGDGSLNCGISLEGLNSVSENKAPLIVVLNDNRMSISSNVGALPRYLNRIISAQSYWSLKGWVRRFLKQIPFVHKVISRVEEKIKALIVPSGLFEELGFRYLGPVNGHDIGELVRTLSAARDSGRSVVVHVVTDKGRGYELAQADPQTYHGVSPFNLDKGVVASQKPSFSSAFGHAMEELAHEHEEVVAITAAMTSGTGLSSYAQNYPKQFFDVGIAEEHAVVFASGLAAGGLRPVVAIYSTFMQRAFDPIYHDVVIQKLPVILAMDRAGAVEDGPTHHGIYDLSFLRAMPNLTILAPASELELRDMLHAAYSLNAPVAIRYGRGGSGQTVDWSVSQEEIIVGKAKVLRAGKDMAIWSYGKECWRSIEVAKIIEDKLRISVAVVNARTIKPFDLELAQEQLKLGMKLVVLEDHAMVGGLADEMRSASLEVSAYGWPDVVVGHGDIEQLREKYCLSVAQLAESMIDEYQKSQK